MPDHRLPKQPFYGELLKGLRSHGGQRKRFKDTLKASLKAFSLNHDFWEQTAMDQSGWRSFLHKGSITCEATRSVAAEQKRQARKARDKKPPEDALCIPCPHCQRTFRAQIGLISHLRTQKLTVPGTVYPINEDNCRDCLGWKYLRVRMVS